MSEQTSEAKILGHRTELNKFYAFAAKHMEEFVIVKERFRPCGRQIQHDSAEGYEVGAVDTSALMRAYVQHMINERKTGVTR